MEGQDTHNNNYGGASRADEVRTENEHGALTRQPPQSNRTLPQEMYIVQFPKDQVYRVPPSENAEIMEKYRNPSNVKRKRNCCSSRLVLTIALIIASIIAVIGVTLAVLYFIFNPTGPTFTVTEFAVKRDGIGNKNLPPKYEVSLRARNPNERLGINYMNNRDVFMTLEGTKVAAGKFPKMGQGNGESTNVMVELTGLNGPMKKSMNVEFDLDMKLGVKMKVGALSTWVMKSNVACKFKVTGLGNDTTILSQECDTNFKQY